MRIPNEQWAVEKIREVWGQCTDWAAHEMEQQAEELALHAAELRAAAGGLAA